MTMSRRNSSKESLISMGLDNKEHFNISDESDLQVRLSSGSTKPVLDDDLLSSNETGKHDYDWLLTTPETSLVRPSNGKESQPTSVPSRRNLSVSSGSTIKTSMLSVSQSESNHSSRPARSSSVTRHSISTTQYTRNTNILSTSSASVSSYTRPSTPTTRSSSSARPSTTSSRTATSRASTPSRTHSSPTTTSIDRTIRQSNPSPRPQSPTVRPSTPTRRTPTPSIAPSSSYGRNAGPTSRPSSPGSRIRPPPQPINLPDFPHETPPNLRTTLPERPPSAGRSRPGAAMTVKGHVENTNTGSITRRPSSPIVNRGRLAEPSGRGRSQANGHGVEMLESRRTIHVPESITRKPIKMSHPENGTGFGRSMSKKSLDMAIKHMDIRNGGERPLSGSTLFPQSIRSGNPRLQPSLASNANNGFNSKTGNFRNGYLESKMKPVSLENITSYSSKLTQVDIYESSRCDAILLKEDMKNTSWLHSADENSDQGSLFDNVFEPLPEPFGPL